jgi:hypothetical protein
VELVLDDVLVIENLPYVVTGVGKKKDGKHFYSLEYWGAQCLGGFQEIFLVDFGDWEFYGLQSKDEPETISLKMDTFFKFVESIEDGPVIGARQFKVTAEIENEGKD